MFSSIKNKGHSNHKYLMSKMLVAKINANDRDKNEITQVSHQPITSHCHTVSSHQLILSHSSTKGDRTDAYRNGLPPGLLFCSQSKGFQRAQTLLMAQNTHMQYNKDITGQRV